MIEVTINPSKKKLTIPAGTLLLDVLKEAGIMITTPCGSKGNCGKCKVKVFPSYFELNTSEKTWLSEEEIKKGSRLACQYHLSQTTTVTVPSYILMDGERSVIRGKIKSHLLGNDFKPAQQIKKIYLQLDPPTLQNQCSDWTRIVKALEIQLKDCHRSWKVPIEILNRMPQLLRNNDFKITIALFHLKKPPSLKVVMVCAWHG